MDIRTPKLFRFALRVLKDFFFHNHGLLLAGSVAYNMMLSLIPLSTVAVVVASHFYDQDLLMESLHTEISLIAPGFAEPLEQAVEGFLANRKVLGSIGAIGLIFFSSMAFRVLENAFAIIFHRPLPTLRRRFWISALLPYLFVLIVSAGLIAISALNAFIDTQSNHSNPIPGVEEIIRPNVGIILHAIGVLGLILLFTLLYQIMPVAKISFKRALAGGLTAGILWEITRSLVVAYYTKVSMVNVLYGSLATLFIVLITLEAVALILLLGAQVIAELQRNANARIPWHQDPGNSNYS
ncbi:MAG: YihY/virulence factor BrkB family protein [Verrucomicrobiota bacterium JB025]|nr:YihY/virulence factor BrkB family protein [Verrucomicrobiota bacterium JB025]